MFYTQEFRNKISKRRNILIVILSLIGVVFATFNTLMFVFLNRDNYLLFEIIICVFDIILLLSFAYILLNYLMKEVHYLKHFDSINNQDKYESKVKVLKVYEEEITLTKDIVCYEILVLENDIEKTYYLLKDFDVKLLKENEEVTLTLCSSFVVGVNHEDE